MKKQKISNSEVSRRDFLKVVGALSSGLIINPTFYPKSAFASKSYTATVATAAVSSYSESYLKNAVEQSLTNLGGLGDIISPGDTVGIKINLTGGSNYAVSYQDKSGLHPGETYWTNPVLLKIVGQAIKDAGASKIYILEALYDWGSIDNFGYREVVDYLGASVIDLNEKDPYPDYIKKSVGENSLIYSELTLNGIFNDLDCLVSMPKAKQHADAGVTHGMKNLVGILPIPSGQYNNGQGYRAGIHNIQKLDNNRYNNLCRVLIDLNQAVPIQLVVNDAIKTVLGSEGPWNNDLIPSRFDRLIIGKDPVAVDSVSTDVIGFDSMADNYNSPFSKSINYLKLANEHGLGEYDLENIEVLQYATGIETGTNNSLPGSITLYQNYPNPFNPSTTIEYYLNKSDFTTLDVYNALGQRVERLVNRKLKAGKYTHTFNATDLSSGFYYYRLNSGSYSAIKKMLLVK